LPCQRRDLSQSSKPPLSDSPSASQRKNRSTGCDFMGRTPKSRSAAIRGGAAASRCRIALLHTLAYAELLTNKQGSVITADCRSRQSMESS
jgi:hypothetical protein